MSKLASTIIKKQLTAKCKACSWESYDLNADGVGAQHALRTGHPVRVKVELEVEYHEGVDEVERGIEEGLGIVPSGREEGK
jgi:hypothetical protein